MRSKLKKKYTKILFRNFRVFDQMSRWIKTRTSLQCRSHHQKAIEKYKDVKRVIAGEKEELKGIDYKNKFKELKDDAKINPLVRKTQLFE